MNHFYAYLWRMKYINRWGLMRNTVDENIKEHSLDVAVLAHALGVIKNKYFNGSVDTARLVMLSIYHDVSEVITGDMATPVKYYNDEIKEAYKKIEHAASESLLAMLPEELRDEYESLIYQNKDDKELLALVKAADKLSAYIKCIEEIKMGNREFEKAQASLKRILDNIDLPELKYFIDNCIDSYSLTLDELNQ